MDIQLAENGYEAIEILNRMKIDIVFMDIKMPKMDGIELTKVVKEKFPEIKIIISSMRNVLVKSTKKK